MTDCELVKCQKCSGDALMSSEVAVSCQSRYCAEHFKEVHGIAYSDLADDDSDIVDILHDHEYHFINQRGLCLGQGCGWRGTQFEWAMHVARLIDHWLDNHLP